MRLPSVMKHDFSKAPQAVIPRSSFDRSHGYKSTFNAGYLIPFYVDEVIPGDTHKLHTTALLRFATLLFPLMDNVHVDIHYFFVPMRILMDNFERLMGYQPNPNDTTDFIFPTVTSTNGTDFNETTIYDYFALATKISGLEVNSMPLRAYNKIWSDWYKDQNLQNEIVQNRDDGPDAPADYALLRRGKRHDYFTSSLPDPQKGAAVELPLGSVAPVVGIGAAGYAGAGPQGPFKDSTGATVNYPFGGYTSASNLFSVQLSSAANGQPMIFADLSEATAATVNDLRQSISVQRMLERDMRSGTRYNELIWGHYGVHTGDARLQRSELLSVSSQLMNVNVVAQTSGTGQTGQTTPIASLAGYGVTVQHSAGFVKSFVEHGYVIGIISARADLTYQQGTDRMWYVSTRFDLYWPEFANLGEQAVLMREIYTTGTSADETVWGYQEAWAHYRYKPSKITGLFRTNATGTLDSWHLSQNLSTPELNATFIQDNPPTTRVKATSGDPDFIMDVYHKLISVRPLPLYSLPGLTRL